MGAPAAPVREGEPAALADRDGRRLLWRCRRGMKELDVLLERFVRRGLPPPGSPERAQLARLLELPDPALAELLLGAGGAGDPELDALLRRIAAA